MVEPGIVMERLVKKYEDVTAVDDLSLRVARGELFGLLGPNG
ncbi:MAG: ABC transporter ATP-binding protein, partial [Thermoproteota archaeon]